MINTAPENLNNIEKWSANTPEWAKEYVPSKINIEEEKNKDNIDLDAAYDNIEKWNQSWDNDDRKTAHEAQHTAINWFNKQTKDFAEKNPELKNRIPAAKNFLKDIKEPQPGNFIGKKLWNRIQKILWPQNT
jgi:hypothetical protein